MQKIKVGDKVAIVAGKDKSREGVVERVIAPGLVIVPEVNLYKRHVKGGGGTKSGIYSLARPLSLAKIALICPKCNKHTRVGFKFAGEEKVRVCKKCGREIDAEAKSSKKKAKK